MSGRTRPAALLLAAAGLTACGGGTSAADAAGTTTVFAAASLREAFTDIARDLEAERPGTTVVLNFGASSALAQQIVNGAPADVFAAASPATMATVVDAGAAREPKVFARNTLQIAVPADATDAVTGLADFADPERSTALCAPEVPCGAAAAEVLSTAGVTPRPDTLEQDVRAALSKVRLGEVDAALVYRTDVLAAGDDVRGIDVPEAATAVNDYALARLAASPNPDGARHFVERVLSQEGQRILADAGFDRP
ncbi:MAG: molybdate ABC transporter substrate-binding protein [Actinomycetota bacterium]|nr:molybdate ABC transporter substrate-binding protein [Actinomycetota bacterium]